MNEAASYIVVVHGRGVLYVCLTKGTEAEVIERAESCLLSGFEVHLYSLKATTSGKPPYMPEGLTPLQQEFNMWDAKEEFTDMVNSIVMRTEEHTINMGRIYLQQCIEQLQEQLSLLSPQAEATGPAFPTNEGPATGS